MSGRLKARRYRRLIALGTAGFFLLSTLFVQGGEAWAISVEKEREAGEKFLAAIRQHAEFADDDFVNEYINDLGQYLIRPVETQPFPFRFYVIKDYTLNAFAGPGGHIFLYSGLIDMMDGIDELASVICHEAAHIAARHLSHRIEQSKKIALATLAGILAAVFVGGDAAGAIMTGTMAAGMQAQLSYSREDERQADQLGFKYMVDSGFSPAGMIKVLNALQRTPLGGSARVPPYLLTHPSGPERIANIEAMLTGYQAPPADPEAMRFRELFPLLKTILRAKHLEFSDAQRLFEAELKADPESATAHFGLGILWKERLEPVRAIEHLKLALRKQGNASPVLRHLGEAYQMNGQDGEAIEVLDRAVDIRRQDKGALYLLGESYENLERYREAIKIFERLSYLEPVRDEVFHHLGMCYGRLGSLARAHYNFGIYFKRRGEAEEARFHFQKAKDLSADDPALRGRIEEAMGEIAEEPEKP